MLPLALTTISIARPDQTTDGYDPAQAEPTPVATGVRATITNHSGTVQLANGQRVAYSFTLNSDPCDVQAGDLVTDDATGEQFRCLWARLRPGLGLDHIEGRMTIVQGAS